MALTDNLISYWKLEEASGNRADSSGNAHTLAQSGAAISSTTGKHGNAANFVLANATDLFSTDGAFNFGNTDFTVAAWFNIGAALVGNAIGSIISNGTAGFASDSYHLYYSASLPALLWTCRLSSGVFGSATINGALPGSTWYYVVAWHDSVNDQIGIDLNPAGSPTTASYPSGTRSIAQFAVGGQSANLWDGPIDSVGIWSRVLSAAERAQLYNGGAGLEYPFVSGPPKFLPEQLALAPLIGVH